MFVFPSYHILYKDTAEIKEELFTYLKEYACFDEVVRDVEEDMDEEVPETQPESQTQSWGYLGHSLSRFNC